MLNKVFFQSLGILRFSVCLGIFFLSTIVDIPTLAQNKSLNRSSKPGFSHLLKFNPKIKIVISADGIEAGKNLFHNFKYFSIRDDEVVRFVNDKLTIKNVFVRVTGGKPSSILGKIESAGLAPNFDFFLINPYGIYFGPNTSLSLNGSFVATTADAIRFGDKGSFSAIKPEDPSLLKIDPSAFYFSKLRPAISYQSSGKPVKGLSVSDGKSLLLVGGKVILNGGKLTALNGRVELGGLAGKGEISLNADGDTISLGFPDKGERADVELSNNSMIDVSRYGSVGIAKGIYIHANNIKISSNSVLLSIIFTDPSSENHDAGKIVNAGEIILDATHNITFNEDGRIFSLVAPDTTGNGNNIAIKSELGSVYFVNGGRIISTSAGDGNAGNITIDAHEKVVFVGQGNPSNESPSIPSQLGSSLLPYPNARGRSGNITIHAKSLSLSDGTSIFTGSGGHGDAGDINIVVDESVSLTNISNPEFPTQIRSVAEAGAIGNGGDITITAPIFSMTGGSVISSFVSGPDEFNELQGAQGNGGDITINASKSVFISGTGNFDFKPGIFANVEKGATGKSGAISITKTNSFILSDHAELNVSNPQGQTGDLKIDANFMTLNNGVIFAETGGSSAGNNAIIKLTASDLLRVENESLISATASDNANGGNINIDTPILLGLPPTGLNGSDIVASAEFGTGGNITINSQGIFGIKERKPIDENRSNDIDASSEFGVQGQVNIDTTLDPIRGLIELPQTIFDPDSLVANNPCRRGSESKFTNSGRGGLPPSLSQDLSNDAAQVGLVEPAPIRTESPQPNAIETTKTSLSSNPSPLVPAQGWVFNDKGEVVLVAYNSAVEGPQRLQATPADCSVR